MPQHKEMITENEDSSEEYVLISDLTGEITHGSDTWIIDSVASKHRTIHKDSLSCLNQKDYSHKVQLGDDYQYPIKGMGEASSKLGTGNLTKIKEVLCVLYLKKNLLSILALDKKGFRVSFVDGEVLMWPKWETINDDTIIDVKEGGLYKLKGDTDSTLTASAINPCELWHRRLSHVNYKALPIVSKLATGLPKFQIDHGVCKGCSQGKNTKNPFPNNNSK